MFLWKVETLRVQLAAAIVNQNRNAANAVVACERFRQERDEMAREVVRLQALSSELQTCNDNLTANLEEMAYLLEVAKQERDDATNRSVTAGNKSGVAHGG